MRTQNQILRAFTLVELMIVISIIAVLVALLFPAIKIALLKAETGKAKGTIMSIASAFKALDREYGGWPNITTYTPQDLATNLFSNPRGIVFLEIASKDISSDGYILDPWKNRYRVAFDPTGANSIANPFSGGTPNPIPDNVIVWSRGPDGLSSDPADGGSIANDADNITSW